MKITKENYESVVPQEDWHLLKALLTDLEEINNNSQQGKQLYIDWQDYHNEYSCERTDPCPDYYGYYRLKFQENQSDCVGDVMTIEELDNALYILSCYTSPI